MKKKYSITRNIAYTMIGMVTGTVLLCWFLNSTFLESFYTVNKENALLEGFHTIDKAVINDTFESDEFDIAFERICSNGNISILVLSPDAQVLRSSAGNSEKLKNQFYGALYESSNKHASEVIKTTDNYIIEKQQDSRLEADYLVLWGTLEDGNLVLMRTALASIKESVMIANEFLAYVAVMATVCCAILAIFVSRRITGPILQLTKISKRMAELDFDAKYKPNKRQNEVDELGEHMNMLSATLETTISELKSANNELKKDIEKKEEIDRMRKEFLSNVSHELKTPLALIQGYAEGLQECINDDEESRDFYCEVIMDEADKMNQMVKKLLTLNQLEFGNDTLTMERFDLTELVKGVVTSSGILLKQKDITVTYPEESVYVWADEFKVEEVMTNYLSNAINHADFEKHIEVTYEKKEDSVRVCVFNTGNPIPEEDLPNIWDKFYKVDKARTREYGGSGIGRSIVKAIMESHHRECGAKNRENGVEFWFELDRDCANNS